LDGVTILEIEPPEQESSFPVLSGIFSDDHGNEVFKIKRNEWEGSSNAWDMEIKGNSILIRVSPKKVALHLKIYPPEKIDIVELDMRLGQSHLILKENMLKVGRITPNSEYYIGIEALECLGADIGVSVDSKNYPDPQYKGLSMVGGNGIELQGTGIKLAVGSGRMLIRGICIEDATKEQTLITKLPLSSNLEYSTTILPPRI